VEIPPGYDEAINIQETSANGQPSRNVAAATYVDFYHLFHVMFNFMPIYCFTSHNP